MRSRSGWVALGFSVFVVPLSATAAETPTSLTGVIRAAERASAELTASQFQERASEARISVRQGDYLPSLEFDAADSWGYAGSSGSMGIPGLAGSPFRAGAGADLLLSGTIWDFGRTAALVSSAKHEAEAAKADSEVRRGEVDHEAVVLYIECVRYRSLLETWGQVEKEAGQVDREVKRFVATGQRSIVDKYLARAQVEQAQTAVADYEKRLLLGRERLAILTQLPAERVGCPTSDSLPDGLSNLFEAHANPKLKRDDENAKAASEQVGRVKADYLPKLKAYVTAGMLEDSHILDKGDYAVGLGVTFPLFDGFKTVNGVKETQASAQRQEVLTEDARYRVNQANAKYDLMIESSRARLAHVQDELKTVNQGFSVARERYFALHGTLVDLREALRNLAAVQADLIDTETSLFAASVDKELFNGSRVKP